MKHLYKGLYKVTTERVVGFARAVERLGTHRVCGHETTYRTEYIRNILSGKMKSEKILKLIAEKVPEMFEVCNCAPEVVEWYARFKEASIKSGEGK